MFRLPECVRGLLLIDAPIDFGEGGGSIARMMAAMPHARSLRLLFGSPVPGSAINLLCASAMPAIFLWQPVADLVAVDMGKQPSSRILTYQAVCGPALQHVGPLVAPGAHERLWPEIIGWIEERG